MKVSIQKSKKTSGSNEVGKKDPPLDNTLWRARPRKMMGSPIQGGEILKNSTKKARMRVCHH